MENRKNPNPFSREEEFIERIVSFCVTPQEFKEAEDRKLFSFIKEDIYIEGKKSTAESLCAFSFIGLYCLSEFLENFQNDKMKIYNKQVDISSVIACAKESIAEFDEESIKFVKEYCSFVPLYGLQSFDTLESKLKIISKYLSGNMFAKKEGSFLNYVFLESIILLIYIEKIFLEDKDYNHRRIRSYYMLIFDHKDYLEYVSKDFILECLSLMPDIELKLRIKYLFLK